MKILECREVTKDFKTGIRGRVRALDNVNLSVNQGEVFGLLGPNGAGKTTLVKILLGLVLPSSGSVTLFDTDIKDFRTRSRVGYLPENPSFPPYLNGEQVMDLFGGLSSVSPEKRKTQADELLKMMNIDQDAERKTSTYSKGMIQRLGLAQAMINNPDIIFLDEPTDGLDPIGRHDVRMVLLKLKEAGKTTFLNSHLLSEVEMVCDRVAIMDKARILTVGSMDELTAETNHFRIACPQIKSKHLNAIETAAISCNLKDGFIDVTVNTIEQLNNVIDLIRGNGLLIESVVQVKRSLESYFINLIKDIRGEGDIT